VVPGVRPGRGGAAGVAGARRFLFPERVHNERTGRESERLARRRSPLLPRPRATCCGWFSFFFPFFFIVRRHGCAAEEASEAPRSQESDGEGRRTEKDEAVLAKPPPSMGHQTLSVALSIPPSPPPLALLFPPKREKGWTRSSTLETPSRSSAVSECAFRTPKCPRRSCIRNRENARSKGTFEFLPSTGQGLG